MRLFFGQSVVFLKMILMVLVQPQSDWHFARCHSLLLRVHYDHHFHTCDYYSGIIPCKMLGESAF